MSDDVNFKGPFDWGVWVGVMVGLSVCVRVRGKECGWNNGEVECVFVL